jgi:hypothetical protein
LGARDCTYDRATSLVQTAVTAQTEAARGLRMSIVDMNDQICRSSRCTVMRDGLVMFTDDNHLTASFSRSLSSVIGSRVDSAIVQLAR